MAKIRITCYGQTEEWGSRAKAKKFYREAINCSEGAERERYVKIYLALEDGEAEISDE